MICKRLDTSLWRFARKYKCRYSRYADDITFSKKEHRLPDNVVIRDSNSNAIIGQELRMLIEGNGFTINPAKSRLLDNQMSQRVTGLIVNSEVNVPRSFVRQIRAMICSWRVIGREAASKKHGDNFYRRTAKKGGVPDIADIIKGKLAYIKMIKGPNDAVYRNLQGQFASVYPDYLATIEKERKKLMSRDVFISHSSKDKDDLVRPLAEQLLKDGYSVWYDEYEISIGDSIRAKIEEGLVRSSCGIVVLSKAFFDTSKKWPGRELDGLFSREDDNGNSLILPVWYGVTEKEVTNAMPTMGGRLALKTNGKTIPELAIELGKAIRKRQ